MDTPAPDGWAVWLLTPEKYDAKAPDGAKGGTLFPSKPSPPMLTLDNDGNCYVAQDGADTILHIDRKTAKCQHLDVPWPSEHFPAWHAQAGEADPQGGAHPRITGPAIATSPDGAIWCSLLGSYNALARIDPMTQKRSLYRSALYIHADSQLVETHTSHVHVYLWHDALLLSLC